MAAGGRVDLPVREDDARAKALEDAAERNEDAPGAFDRRLIERDGRAVDDDRDARILRDGGC